MSQNFSTPSAIRLLACGGTFDKRYNEMAGILEFTTSHLPDVMRQARVDDSYACEVLPLQDSLDMTVADRQRILDHCRAANESALVIVHGTDTMAETALLLDAAQLRKTIVLTGAMIPLDIANSDALFNLGFACACARTLGPGVYVAMNGRIFPGSGVRKNKNAGSFELR